MKKLLQHNIAQHINLSEVETVSFCTLFEQGKIIDNLSKTADQRYLDFIEKYPFLYNHLSNLQIATYLGISHEFLSKIRKKIATK